MDRRTLAAVTTSTRGPSVLALSLLLLGCGDSGDVPAPSAAELVAAGPAAVTDVDADWTTGETADGNWSIAWRPEGGVIPSLDPFAVEVVVRDRAGGEVPDAVTVLVDATMPHHGHGMNVEPRIERLAEETPGGGVRFRAEGMLLHMPGRWEFTVDVVRGGDVERAQWTVMLDD